MKVNITIERPDGTQAEFVKDYPTIEIARVLTESELVVMDAIYAEAYQGRSGRLVKVEVAAA